MRSGKTSATAARSQALSAFKAWAAAPVPRPPHPTKPTLMALVTEAPERMPGNPLTSAPPMAPEAPVFRKSRRECDWPLRLIFVPPGAGESAYAEDYLPIYNEQ